MINFEYDISPLSVLQSFESKPLYQFLTRFMAIIGGVFAVRCLCLCLFVTSRALFTRRTPHCNTVLFGKVSAQGNDYCSRIVFHR